MRQAGICAAACLYALDHNIDRLADDHANARALARGLAQIPGITVEEPETNLVFFDTTGTGLTADELAAARPPRGRHAVHRRPLPRPRLHASRRRSEPVSSLRFRRSAKRWQTRDPYTSPFQKSHQCREVPHLELAIR